METPEPTAQSPKPKAHGAEPPLSLTPHYSRFRVTDRILLTGHSHQAWPDVAFDAQQRAWLDAAEFVDDKWSRAEQQAQRIREGFARLLNDRPERIALGQNTHELVTRWLSALPLRDHPQLVTTDGEFHTIRRQLDRLGEEAVSIIKVAARPTATLAERLAASVSDMTAAVMVSSVLYETAEIVPNLGTLAAACRRHGTRLLVDAYHHLNVVPFDIDAMGLADAFVTGGGYKYCQLGEGNAFLRVPPDCQMRPILTGWFAEFGELAVAARAGTVVYPPGAAAFAGATYDPTSHYRGAAVFAFHQLHHLTPERLQRINRAQVSRLEQAFLQMDLDPADASLVQVPADQRGGFLALMAPRATEIVRDLRARGVYADARGNVLRLGPAPYVSDEQLRDAIAAVGDWLRGPEQ